MMSVSNGRSFVRALVLAAVVVASASAAKLGCPATALPNTPEEAAYQKKLSAQFLGHWEGDPFTPIDEAFEGLSAQVGVAPDVLRYFLGCLSCYVLAVFHSFIPDRNADVKHAYSLICGLTLSWISFGVNTLIPLGSSLLVFYICKYVKSRYTPAIVFFVAMGLSSGCHVYRLFIDYGGYTLDVSGPQMIITIKLTSFAWNCYDHGKKQDKYKHRVASAVDIDNTPLLHCLSFIFFFAGYLAGPGFEFQEYVRFTNGKLFESDPEGKPSLLSRVIPSMYSFLTGIFHMGVMLTLSKQFDPFSLLCDSFDTVPVYKQILLIYVSVALTRAKYYCIWNIADGAMVLSGFGYNGRDAKTNQVKWDRMVNAHIFRVEAGESVREAINSWNIKTSMWLRKYSYERLLENNYSQAISQYVTMLVSGFWHGFYGGYYLTFGFGAYLQQIGKSLRGALRPIFEDSASAKTPFWYNTGGRVLTALMLNWCTVSFMLVDSANAFKVWKSASYVGFGFCLLTQFGLFALKSTSWHRAKAKAYKALVAERRAKKRAAAEKKTQ